ncbi:MULTISPECIES: hypothetical protein [unclassified Janthinobacterium]|uniref:hypothetical protein n=1 Tax=unclassified Janthinobacterium TaxID=2610881 RepID=UPI0012F9ED9E|nr:MULTISPECIES: hypothetical protein [unclassified Janthinobacterium]MEC5162749.1 hypothetical protein [Janthinobacterium sp. CG_S6]
MAKRVKPAEIRRRLSNDLISLSQILERNTSAVVLNADVLKSSANQCLQDHGKFWEYQVAGLQLQVIAPQNVLPKGAGKVLNLTIDLDLCGFCDEELEHSFKKLILKVRIENEDRSSMCSWHFDQHIFDEVDESIEAHPLYHFQHGGHEMKELADSLGKVLLLPAPRMASPPMEAILCIDFLLSNFAGNEWKNLRNDATYVKLLQEAQFRLWKPYVERLATWWAKGPKSSAPILELWPHLA